MAIQWSVFVLVRYKGQLNLALQGNEKQLTTDQACWYLNKSSYYEGFKRVNLVLILYNVKTVKVTVEGIQINKNSKTE